MPTNPPALTAIASGFVVLCAGLCAWAMDAPALAPPLGVTAYLCFRHPTGEASRVRSILGGHALGIASGFLALFICQAHTLPAAIPGPFAWQHGLASALAIALTAFSTETLRCPHPPAGATTLVVSLGLLHTRSDILAFCLGTIVVASVAGILNMLINRRSGGKDGPSTR